MILLTSGMSKFSLVTLSNIPRYEAKTNQSTTDTILKYEYGRWKIIEDDLIRAAVLRKNNIISSKAAEALIAVAIKENITTSSISILIP